MAPQAPEEREAAALALIAENGYEPAEPYPGRNDLYWRIRCTTCGIHRNRKPRKRDMKPCTHYEQQRAQLSESKAAKDASAQHLKDVLQQRNQELDKRFMVALEPYPGEGQLWWVACKYCHRAWHMPEGQLRACPHKGVSDEGHPPVPEHLTKHESNLASGRRRAAERRTEAQS